MVLVGLCAVAVREIRALCSEGFFLFFAVSVVLFVCRNCLDFAAPSLAQGGAWEEGSGARVRLRANGRE